MSQPLRALAGIALAALSPLALAHSPIKDIGNFYGGLLHPLLIPAHALLVGALGLLLGQQPQEQNKYPLLAFLVAAVAGLAFAAYANAQPLEHAQLLTTAVVGLLVALNPAVPLALLIAASALAGILVGADSGQPDLTSAALFASLVGTALGMGILLLCTMGFADYCKERAWRAIGVRIIGSWITASALLVLSLSLSPTMVSRL